MSQLTGTMVEQSWPAGQQRTALIDDVVFNTRQVVDCGQQKSEGIFDPHWVSEESPPHELEPRAMRPFVAVGSKSSGIQITRAAES